MVEVMSVLAHALAFPLYLWVLWYAWSLFFKEEV